MNQRDQNQGGRRGGRGHPDEGGEQGRGFADERDHDPRCRKAVPAHARLTCDPPKYCVSAIKRPRKGVQHQRNVLNPLACIGRDADCDSGGGVLTWSPLS